MIFVKAYRETGLRGAGVNKARSARKLLKDGLTREIGVVTLGVLIALGIGEVADYVRWQFRVRTSMAALRSDLADARYTFLERKVIQPCIDRQFEVIGKALGIAHHTGRMPAVSGLVIYPMRIFNMTAWEVAKSEGVALHMVPERALALTKIYSAIASYPGSAIGPETANWQILMAIPNLAGRIDANIVSSLILALRQAEAQSLLSSTIASQEEANLAKLGVPIAWPDFYPRGEMGVKEMRQAMRTYGVCGQLSLDGHNWKKPVY